MSTQRSSCIPLGQPGNIHLVRNATYAEWVRKWLDNRGGTVFGRILTVYYLTSHDWLGDELPHFSARGPPKRSSTRRKSQDRQCTTQLDHPSSQMLLRFSYCFWNSFVYFLFVDYCLDRCWPGALFCMAQSLLQHPPQYWDSIQEIYHHTSGINEDYIPVVPHMDLQRGYFT